jgi:hypothetical protein
VGVVDINGRPEVADLIQEIPMEMADISGRLEVEDLIQEIVMEVAITFSNVSK